ncbi:MAG TPA: S8 family serine peptidase, partial [Bryobacteraceae bacterium]|nr:S8 family serine peptidase [Bryobacteraceae bacterium]
MTRRIAVLMTLALASAAFAASPRLGRYALVLEEPPVARQIASRAELDSPAAKAAAARIQAKQAALKAELKQRGVAVTGATQIVLNAVFVQAGPNDAQKLRGLGGVSRSVYLPPAHRSLDAASTLIKAPQAWTAIGGMQSAGTGVKIGILDTGIDQTHPAFQQACTGGPSQPFCSGDDCKYTNGKVIAARSYVRFMAAGWTAKPEETSRPDDLSPRDRDGHGTALAMIAAGNTVQAPGATLTGVAPQACLGNYKVFGSPGVNSYASYDAVIQALDDAYSDGMDIVSLSFGNAPLYGPLDQMKSVGCGVTGQTPPDTYCDPRIEAIENASKGSNGMTVVVAAGNGGDLALDSQGYGAEALNSVDSPGTAPSAITVGASTNSHAWRESVQVTGTDVPGSLQKIAARFGDGVRPGGPMAPWPIRDAGAIGDPLACSSFPADSLRDAIV